MGLNGAVIAHQTTKWPWLVCHTDPLDLGLCVAEPSYMTEPHANPQSPLVDMQTNVVAATLYLCSIRVAQCPKIRDSLLSGCVQIRAKRPTGP